MKENIWFYTYRGNGYGPFVCEEDAIRARQSRGPGFAYTWVFDGKKLVASPSRIEQLFFGQGMKNE